MTAERAAARVEPVGTVFGRLGYEVMPFKATEQNVLSFVPLSTPLTVTASPPKGIEATIALTERLVRHGYTVSPHLSAKMITGRAQLAEIVSRLEAIGVDSIFVVGGDAAQPAGDYTDALSLLRSLQEIGHIFTEVGIGGYPEGHAVIPREKLTEALIEKSQLATYIATQICFDPRAIAQWAREVKASGVDLPIRVGMPGAVSRQKLLRISLASGVGDSVAFLKKQQSMFWRFFMPGGYSPDKLIRGLGPVLAADDNEITDFHIFTFNDLENTEKWRQKSLARFSR